MPSAVFSCSCSDFNCALALSSAVSAGFGSVDGLSVVVPGPVSPLEPVPVPPVVPAPPDEPARSRSVHRQSTAGSPAVHIHTSTPSGTARPC